jgi:hypothetical protein
MRKFVYLLALLPFMLLAEDQAVTEVQEESVLTRNEVFEPFTGKVEGSRVRVRLRPDLSSHIICELTSEDLIAVVDEDSEFYSIKPTIGSKAYVFRTYVLDDVVEGARVNVRLEPNLNAPVVYQLNTGDSARGEICENNSKWLEIEMPKDVVFYVSNDYVTKVGEPDYLVVWEQRRGDVNTLLTDSILISKAELSKEFPAMNYDKVEAGFLAVLENYDDFSNHAEQAAEALELFKDEYLKKKVAFLEQKFEEVVEAEIEEIDEEIAIEEYTAAHGDNMLAWGPAEQTVYGDWLVEHPDDTIEDYYIQSQENAIKLSGTIETYGRAVKNKPGDYVLRDKRNLPVAYLYSTKVDLQDIVGQQIEVLVAPRDNNNFAFPAYFVLSVE